MFITSRQWGLLAGSAVVALALLIWVFDFAIGPAIGVTLLYSVIAVAASYYKNRASSRAASRSEAS